LGMVLGVVFAFMKVSAFFAVAPGAFSYAASKVGRRMTTADAFP
jgi:hypothetical protein